MATDNLQTIRRTAVSTENHPDYNSSSNPEYCHHGITPRWNTIMSEDIHVNNPDGDKLYTIKNKGYPINNPK